MIEQPLRQGERIDDLIPGGLKIIQNASAPCFSLDAVLLAAFAPLKPGWQVVDLGTGTGVLPLLLHARESSCSICGLELMGSMADMARRSVALNGLENSIRIITGDIRNAAVLLGKAQADLVTANPPYFQPGRGRESLDPLWAAARSERFCPLSLLFEQAALLLKPLGRLALVHRAERLAELLSFGREQGLHAERLRLVQPRLDKPANLLLLEFRKGSRQQLLIEPALWVYGRGSDYSPEMQAIYQAWEVLA